jgi:lipoprotein-anchoring transpeptidase ErfK/SrfK
MNTLTIKTLAILAFTAEAARAQTTAPATQPAATTPERRIVVSLEDRKLALLEDGEVKKIYTVAVGKPSSPSPQGVFSIRRRVANPVYQHNGQTIQPGPRNPVGTRWMGLSVPGYGIHGTNEPNSIGKAASHGCIRMSKADLEEFYTLVNVGDTVEIIGQRNEVTARLFTPATPAAKDTTQLAAASVATPAQPTPQLTLQPVAAR